MQRGGSMAFDQTLEHFRARGFMRVPGAFSRHEAEAMRAAVWRVLEGSNIREGEPSTWTTERPTHLQELKDDPVFGAAWGPRTRAAIGQILESASWPDARSWGGFFITFPSAGEWNVPSSAWHADARYTSALAPPEGVRLHALMGEVEPRSGASVLLAGSHKLLHRWFKNHPSQPGARGSDHRKSLMSHPYIRDLHKEAGADERIARFMGRAEEHDGIELQVVENIGAAGDVILAHPLLLHAASLNAGRAPRFLLSGAVDLDSMWGAA
jgi:Phytanoyl-CoA dioxygenase (PhyH)